MDALPTKKSGFSTVWLLAIANAIALSASPMIMLIGSIIGVELAPKPQWATLPVTSMIVGTACGVVPATRCMALVGRKYGFMLFIAVGTGAALLTSQALVWGNFYLFCFGAGLIGVSNAALQQIRFAAMESVALDKGPAAASVIMCAGIVAAFLGPELALLGKDLSTIEYRGSFWLAAACLVFAGCLLSFYQPAKRVVSVHVTTSRSISQMLGNRNLVLAILSGSIAFVVMSFVMTATPISMHHHHGHSLQDTKWVIQWHIAAMFLPSLFTTWLFRLINIRGLMIAGLCCYSLTIVIGLFDSTVIGFWGQLVMLGIGWNFLFISGTALLPSAHREGEQYRAQALNDTVIFSTQAIASLSAGWAVSQLPWDNILLLCLVPILIMAGALLWHRKPL